MKEQEKVAKFIDRQGLEGTTAFQILDLAAEVGEIAADAAKTAEYGTAADELEVKEDEIGDALFSLLAVANSLEIDAKEALDAALEKYRDRIEEKGDPGSRSR